MEFPPDIGCLIRWHVLMISLSFGPVPLGGTPIDDSTYAGHSIPFTASADRVSDLWFGKGEGRAVNSANGTEGDILQSAL